MIEPVNCVLGGVVIAFISGAVGKALGSNGKVKEGTCVERQHACSTLVISKIDNLSKGFDDLKKAVNSKLLGL